MHNVPPLSLFVCRSLLLLSLSSEPTFVRETPLASAFAWLSSLPKWRTKSFDNLLARLLENDVTTLGDYLTLSQQKVDGKYGISDGLDIALRSLPTNSAKSEHVVDGWMYEWMSGGGRDGCLVFSLCCTLSFAPQLPRHLTIAVTLYCCATCICVIQF